jgi:hypothetical protein
MSVKQDKTVSNDNTLPKNELSLDNNVCDAMKGRQGEDTESKKCKKAIHMLANKARDKSVYQRSKQSRCTHLLENATSHYMKKIQMSEGYSLPG